MNDWELIAPSLRIFSSVPIELLVLLVEEKQKQKQISRMSNRLSSTDRMQAEALNINSQPAELNLQSVEL